MADLALVRELAPASKFLAVFTTTRPNGSVHASLVSAGIIDDPETGKASIGVVVAGKAKKLEYLRRDSRATVVFKDGWRWVAVEGPVRLEGPDDPAPSADRTVPDVIRDVYKAAGGTHDDWAAFDRTMANERRCAVFIAIDRISSNG
jgi:PPOX class probable F420-dependent enzyme